MYLHHHYISLNIGDLSPSPLELMIPSEKNSIKPSNIQIEDLSCKKIQL